MLKSFHRTLAALALGLSGATALGQGTDAILSIDVTRQTIALTISDAGPGSILYIQGSADLGQWETLGQAIAGKTPTRWETQRAATESPYFFRVKVDPPTDVMEDGIYATITTNLGVMTARLEYEKVPLIVANFIGLAEGTKFYSKDPRFYPANPDGKPYFDGLIFHRVMKDFMIQGGCPQGNGHGNPGYFLPDQFHPDLKHDGPGVLSMANSGEHTNGSQFFITHAATPWLDFDNINRLGSHSVFGKVVLGLDVVDKIAGVDVSGPNKPTEDVIIESIRILRVGEKAEAFEATEASIDQMQRDIAARQMKEIQAVLKIEPTDSGLIYEELKPGSGKRVKDSDTVTFDYIMELVSEANENGRIFADSYNPPKPLTIKVSDLATMLPGAAEGLTLMKKGGIGLLCIPPELAYGKLGWFAARVPAHSVVLMQITMLDVMPGG